MSSKEAVNTNFSSRWFDPTQNRTRDYRFSSVRCIHSTTDRDSMAKAILRNNYNLKLFCLGCPFPALEPPLMAVPPLKVYVPGVPLLFICAEGYTFSEKETFSVCSGTSFSFENLPNADVCEPGKFRKHKN